VADIHHTKHYYAGTERLCCRIGGGGLQGLRENIVSDSLVSVKEKTNYQMMEEDLSCVGSRAETKGLSFRILDKFMEVQIPEEGIYFYHPDHLGSASWITDITGQAVQHMQYLPYGETKLDQRTSSYHERYTFTGKEKDSETGYYYFGARYYNPDLSLWLSVDPMADKYPSLSPYNYCAWNPMKIVDPDGMDGVCKVNPKTKTLTVTANYYVRTGPELRSNRESAYLYGPRDVEKMQKSINAQLNNANYTVTEGEYTGYAVNFDLNFIPVERSVDLSMDEWPNVGMNDYFGGVKISNTFEKHPDGSFFRDEDNRLAIGKTDNHRGIVMNSKYDNKRSRIHEIFHTLFYDNDDAPDGIGNYNPGVAYPNQADINSMIKNANLKKVIIDE